MSQTLLELKGIRKSYGGGRSKKLEVLKGVDLLLDKPQKVAILGQSGSGKSTMLAMMAGLDRPDEGSLKILGKDVGAIDEASLASFRGDHIGIVFQQFHLLQHLNAWENVALPLEIRNDKDAEQKAKILLKEVGLSERIEHKPSQLSGGECQRVAIARALACKPNIIFADEPSGNLDQETGKSVMELLFKVVAEHGSLLILVTHNLELAAACDRVFVLNSGILREKNV